VLKSIEKPDREERKTSIHVNNCDEKTDVAEIIKQTQTARADKFSEVYMDLDDFLGPKPTVIDLRAKDRWEAIDELVGHLAVTNKIRPDHQEAILAAVRRREKAMSTGVGFEIGLPHASSDLVSEVVGVVGRSHLGIPFDARDGKPVKLVLLFLVPAGQFHKHLNTLANIAKLLHRKDFRDGLWGRFT
jgi:mannitol/fructose-specific phosphotransferase system IIA component (Ntr-type)